MKARPDSANAATLEVRAGQSMMPNPDGAKRITVAGPKRAVYLEVLIFMLALSALELFCYQVSATLESTEFPERI